MDRQAKIEMLQMIQDGKLNPKDYEDLPGGVLTAITGDLGEFSNKTNTNRQCYFASKYEDENGVICNAEQAKELCDKYGEAPYVLHVVEKHTDGKHLIITGIFFMKQSKKNQLENAYLSLKKNTGTPLPK